MNLKVLRAVIALIAMIVLILISAWTDFDYMFNGKVVEGKLISAVRGKPGDSRDQRVFVGYSFLNENGALRQGNDELPRSWEVPQGSTIKVRYLPGTNRSRVDGNSDGYWLFALGVYGGVFALLFVVAYFMDDGTSQKKRKRKRRRPVEM
jgi:hypothetical protein